MSMDDVLDSLKTDAEELKKWIGVYIGVLAVLLPVCNVGGANAAKDATRANIEASNVWAFYQATNVRRTVYSVAADELEAHARHPGGDRRRGAQGVGGQDQAPALRGRPA